ENKTLKDETGVVKAEAIFTQALNEGRVLPAQKDELVATFKGKETEFTAFLDKFPKNTFTAQMVPAGGVKGKKDTPSGDGKKFTKDDGTPLTFKDVSEDPSLYVKHG